MRQPRHIVFSIVRLFIPGKHLQRSAYECIAWFFDILIRKRLLLQQHIIKNIRDDFQNYAATHNINSALQLLKLHTDSDAIRLIDMFWERHINPFFFFNEDELRQYSLSRRCHIPYYFSTYDSVLRDVFLLHCGMVFLPQEVLSLIKNGAAIDGGAAAGDSSLVISAYKPTAIYAFEPSERHARELEKTIYLNQAQQKIKIVRMGLGTDNGTALIHDQYADTYQTSTTSIDSFAKDKIISLIKLDIEGMEYSVIEGAKKTIYRDKPILLISIYHAGRDFFDIKPLIESWKLGYQFIIRDTEPCNGLVGVHLMLIGYVFSLPLRLQQPESW